MVDHFNVKTTLSNKHLKDLLPSILAQVEELREEQPYLLLSTWEQLIPEEWRPMARAVSFDQGVLIIHVSNATLYTLLMRHHKEELLKKLKKKFPQNKIKALILRMG